MRLARWVQAGVGALLLAAAVVGVADTFGPPRPRVFASKYGSLGFRAVPKEPNSYRTASTGTLFSVQKDGTDRVVWTRELVNTPGHALVEDDGAYVVTVDTYARRGYEHSLVIYGAEGKIVADLKLEDLLTPEEIKQHVFTSVTSRWWAEKARFEFRRDRQTKQRLLVIMLDWARELRIDLATGKLVPYSPNAGGG